MSDAAQEVLQSPWTSSHSLSGLTLMASTFVAFVLFSAGLPHTVYYFYPAVMLLVAIRVLVAARARGLRQGLMAAWPPLVGQALGLWLAAYKLWPVVRWQMDFPRRGVLMESFSPAAVLGGVFTFSPETWDTSVVMGSLLPTSRGIPRSGRRSARTRRDLGMARAPQAVIGHRDQ